jgi:hypothetical protein
MFFWPCISLGSSNKNWIDTIFILSLFRQSTSTFFGHTYNWSSGGILYIYNNWYVLCSFQHNTYQLLYIYSTHPDDGLQICPKRVDVDWRNKQDKLCIKLIFIIQNNFEYYLDMGYPVVFYVNNVTEDTYGENCKKICALFDQLM